MMEEVFDMVQEVHDTGKFGIKSMFDIEEVVGWNSATVE